MARSEALKQAQRRYRLKNGYKVKGRTESLKQAQKRSRQKKQDDPVFKKKEAERKRNEYHKNRNYKYLDNMSSSFKILYGDEYYYSTY